MSIFLGGFQEDEYFWGMMILWIFLGSSKTGLVLGVISMHFRIFVQDGDILGCC